MPTVDVDRSTWNTVATPELRMLGGFDLRVSNQSIVVPESSQRLLVYLALHDRPQPRRRVAGTLWSDCNERRAAANLRAALWRLPCASPFRLVQSDSSGLSIPLEVRVDVRRVQALGWSLVRDASALEPEADLPLFFDDLLPGWYDEWVIVEQERLGQLRLHFLEALTFALLRQNRVPEALDVALRLVASDPLREKSQRALISVYRAEGSLGQAARQLAHYRELTRAMFGCDPSDEIVQLGLGVVTA